jgi:hypothetical protein
MPQIVNFTAFIAPGSNVDTVVVQQACRFDVGKTSDARVRRKSFATTALDSKQSLLRDH